MPARLVPPSSGLGSAAVTILGAVLLYTPADHSRLPVRHILLDPPATQTSVTGMFPVPETLIRVIDSSAANAGLVQNMFKAGAGLSSQIPVVRRSLPAGLYSTAVPLIRSAGSVRKTVHRV